MMMTSGSRPGGIGAGDAGVGGGIGGTVVVAGVTGTGVMMTIEEIMVVVTGRSRVVRLRVEDGDGNAVDGFGGWGGDGDGVGGRECVDATSDGAQD